MPLDLPQVNGGRVDGGSVDVERVDGGRVNGGRVNSGRVDNGLVGGVEEIVGWSHNAILQYSHRLVLSVV